MLRFRLSFLGVISALLVAISVAIRDGFDSLVALSLKGANNKTYGLLCLAEIMAALAAATAFASFQRRPDVYDKDRLVDQQHTMSLLQRFSFSWNRMIFDTARERQMQISDIPTPDFRTRSKNLRANYLAKSGEGSLWRKLIRVYFHELSIQWIMTLLIAILGIFPQIVLYNFLKRIESRRDFTSTDPTLFIWVFGLFLSQVLQVSMGNWLRWITDSRLDIPVGSLLQSLVFAKALEQYETATPGQKETDEKDGKKKKDSSDKTDAPKTGSRSEKGKDKGTRQSVINHMKLDRYVGLPRCETLPT